MKTVMKWALLIVVFFMLCFSLAWPHLDNAEAGGPQIGTWQLSCANNSKKIGVDQSIECYKINTATGQVVKAK